ncbi:9354_t:CDS:1, partial [Cetraspora pellucida]
MVETMVKTNLTTNLTLINELKIKPTSLIEWKRRHYLTNYLNKNQKVKVYLISAKQYGRMDVKHLKYNHDGTLTNCDMPCIWNMTDLDDLTPDDLKTADALFCVDQLKLPNVKSWDGQKFIRFTNEPPANCPWCYYMMERFDFLSSYTEDSNVPTSYIREDPIDWLARQPFNIENLSDNSTFVSFIASHWTDFRKDWVPKLQAHIPVASFGN